ncbi:26S proteasome non-ATPase regulatory subunit 9 [Halyomorpha halys]|uniref:26S proteasome non-ATPase regulatory subunit 9 n=1 Tax=Halyomorpha halys TaxID=286706 RepID=UPI0006D51FAF|nr:26S proteasome non-ATPase regulatory subunit 9 [Halyomorpha halys]
MESLQEELNDALSNRKEIESKISELNEILKANNIGMNDELVDKQGFPRNDINVYEVRHARAQLIKEQNDYKLAMKKCEDLLIKYHSQNLPEFADRSERPSISVKSHKKIAVVGKVETGSPSEYAGLREGDILLEFGKINGDNMRNINDISEEMKRNLNLYIKVVVKRDGEHKRFNLKPKEWSGRGYLGCVLNP